MIFRIKTLYFAFLIVLGFAAITVLPIDVKAGSSPYDVPSTVRSGWDSTYGGKMFNEYSGKMLIYDIYSTKIISGGYNIQNKNFGNGTQPYVAFSGWAVLFGHKDHTSSNNDTYIVAKKVSGESGIGTEKVYGTVTRGLSATEDLEYNNQGAGLYNECGTSVTNVPNDTCNMRYDSVGFDAYLPLNELFPNSEENATWNLFLVKQVDSKLVYTPLILPFSFSDRSFNGGDISLSSGISANTLTMNTSGVLRRDYPRESASSVIADLGSNRYFTESQAYTRVDSEETQTAIWYGVRSPHDGNRTKWAATAYWVFSGSQASIKYTPPPDTDPPTHISHELLNYRYKNGDDYWYQPNDQAYVRLRQHDQTGNLFQYLSLLGSGLEVKSQHDFTGASNHNNDFVTNSNVVINSATREENTKYGKVKWGVIPKTHGHGYNVQYYYRDTQNNVVGYNDTGMDLWVDGQEPEHISHELTNYRYKNGNDYWVKPNDSVTIRLRQRDNHSGNKFNYLRLYGSGVDVRSQHVFSEANNHNNQFSKNSNVVISAAYREEDTNYGKVRYTVQPKTHGQSYSVMYYYQDNVDNNSVDYKDTSMELKVDGQAPAVRYRNTGDTADFLSRGWSNSAIQVRLKFSDNGSGYKQSRYAWSASTATPTNWTAWTSDSDYNVTRSVYGKWFLHVQAEDQVGNVTTTYEGTYNYNNPPVANFTFSPSTIYNDTTVQFKNSSTDPDGDTLTYQWAYQSPGSGSWVNFSTAKDPSRILNIKGTWAIRLTVTDENGASDTAIKNPVVVNRPPVANFTFSPSTIYNDTTVQFTNKSTDPDGDTLTYQWAYQSPGSGSWVNFSTAKDPSRILNIKGTWAIRLIVTDESGASATVVKNPVVVNRPPIPGFNFDKSIYYEGDTIKVNSTASDPDGDTLTYKYTVLSPSGSSVTFNAASFTYRVVEPGTYKVTQTVTDTANASVSLTKDLIVNPLLLTGIVEHTIEWKRIHDDMNHPDNFFFSGERFLVSATVTNHPIEFVSVQFKGNQINNVELNINKVLDNFHPVYKGEIYDPKMSNPTTKLSNGNVYFLFTAKWSNGTTKQDLVQVEILDDVYKAYDFYRTN